MNNNEHIPISDRQLQAEMDKCLFCEEKPCKEACPADCSPADFIMAARNGEPQDFQRAAAEILSSNPLGGVCGAVCPDYHCMEACVYKTFNHPVNIPAVQDAIIRRVRSLPPMQLFKPTIPGKAKIAVIGAGPAGLAAAAVLAAQGHLITVFDKEQRAGGMCNLIPDSRLDKQVLYHDIEFLQTLGSIEYQLASAIDSPEKLKDSGYAAVIVAAGLAAPLTLGIEGEESCVNWVEYLKRPGRHPVTDRHVVIIGGGAVALDCAMTAMQEGAVTVRMICLEKPSEMNLDNHERKVLFESGIDVWNRTQITKISTDALRKNTMHLQRVDLPEGERFHPQKARPIRNSEHLLEEVGLIIMAIGARPDLPVSDREGLFYCGDMVNGPTTVVQAVAAGKNCAAQVEHYLQSKPVTKTAEPLKSRNSVNGRVHYPVPLTSDFFGRQIASPFLLSAAPPTDGYEAMKRAYEAGWAGGIMKTAFNGLDIHIPAEYMFVLGSSTFANCDNVSAHPLERVCEEIHQLVKEYPDRLTMASTGGPVTGNDRQDKKVWQHNTRLLEEAGAMGIEFSLSCPQGGDGTEGDIVAQNARLTAKIVDWIMEVGSPEIPKLFKLTGAVTAIEPILMAIKEVLARYPQKKAGVTLANTFPALDFRPGTKENWEEGIVVGLSGRGVTEISNLSLAKAAPAGLVISGNGGPMHYKAAAHFLALGAQTVQFCSVVMKYGYDIIKELNSGLSFLLKHRGLDSVAELIGVALPGPVTDFMELSPHKKIASVRETVCLHCGNCSRCSYGAIVPDDDSVPQIDAVRCIGCSFCVQMCFSGALFMRERTADEQAKLQEA